MQSSTLTRGVFCLYIVLCVPTGAWPEDSPDVKILTMAPTITVTGVDVRDNHFRLDYKVENGSERDIWICDAMDSIQWGAPAFEAVASEDGRTLTVRKRIGLPWVVFRDQIQARYVRLKAGKSFNASLVIPLPARSQTVVSSKSAPDDRGRIQRIVLEVGYYKGDLVAGILDARYMLELLHFNEINEYRSNSNTEVLFRSDTTDPVAKSESLLQTAVDTRPMSYEAMPDRRHAAPDLRRCDRIEISYEPSALEYFFSYEDQRCVLSRAEMSRIRSLHKVVVDNDVDIKEFTSQVSGGVFQGISTRPVRAHVICYEGRERVAALDVYRDCFLTEGGEPFSFRDAKYPEEFRMLMVRGKPQE